MKLNNLLNFEVFLKLNNEDLKKKTKRTEIGGDVLNEHIYDKIIYSGKNTLNIKEQIEKLKSNIISGCKNGFIKNLDIKEDVINFTLFKRKYCINKKDNTICLYEKKYEKTKDPVTNKKISKRIEDKEVKISINKDIIKELYDSLKTCEVK